MLAGKHEGNEVLAELTEKLKRKDDLLTERDQRLDEIAKHNQLLQTEKEDLRTRIRDHAGDQVALARRTTTRIAREIGQDTNYTEGDAAVEIDRLKNQNEELKAQIVVL